MRKPIILPVLFSVLPTLVLLIGCQEKRTHVSIEGEQILINGKPTYEGRMWEGHNIEGLLFNSRMVQGIFDDENPETRERWKYPDTNEWDPNRNTREFVASMQDWHAHGVLGFTINLQGGSPMGYGNKNWRNTAFAPDGSLKPAYFSRLELILDEADRLGMVPIIGLFYFGQDQFLNDETAVYKAIDGTFAWLFEKGYRNLLIEISNECNGPYDHAVLECDRIHELVTYAKDKEHDGYRLLIGTSYGGGVIPKNNVVGASDFILIHGNGVGEPEGIREMVDKTRGLDAYEPMPIIFNEDDHYAFDKPMNNLVAAVEKYTSWGYFDFRRGDEPFEEGYQSVPVDWQISTDRKRAFFEKVKEITGY